MPNRPSTRASIAEILHLNRPNPRYNPLDANHDPDVDLDTADAGYGKDAGYDFGVGARGSNGNRTGNSNSTSTSTRYSGGLNYDDDQTNADTDDIAIDTTPLHITRTTFAHGEGNTLYDPVSGAYDQVVDSALDGDRVRHYRETMTEDGRFQARDLVRPRDRDGTGEGEGEEEGKGWARLVDGRVDGDGVVREFEGV